MVHSLGFLEDQANAILTWRGDGSSSQQSKILVGVGNQFHLMDEELDIVQSVSIDDGQINRLVSVSEGAGSSAYFSTTLGEVGFVSLSHNAVGKISSCKSAIISQNIQTTAIDSDIHRSGYMASVLFNSRSGGHFSLVDTQRDSLIGTIGLGATGSPNALRFVDSAGQIAVASMVSSLFDVRTTQSKDGIPSRVFRTGDAAGGGRSFTALESDGGNTLIAGDSAGGLWLWDIRGTSAEPIKSVHAHSGAVLSIHLCDGIVGSTSTDNSVSLWTIAEPPQTTQGVNKTKKHRKLLVEFGEDIGRLKRVAVEGNGSALGICIEESVSGKDRRVAYVTDTGIVALSEVGEWQ